MSRLNPSMIFLKIFYMEIQLILVIDQRISLNRRDPNMNDSDQVCTGTATSQLTSSYRIQSTSDVHRVRSLLRKSKTWPTLTLDRLGGSQNGSWEMSSRGHVARCNGKGPALPGELSCESGCMAKLRLSDEACGLGERTQHRCCAGPPTLPKCNTGERRLLLILHGLQLWSWTDRFL